MSIAEYTSPQVVIDLAGQPITDVAECEVRSSRSNPIALAEFRCKAGPEAKEGDPCVLYMGWDADMLAVFSGDVEEVEDGAELVVRLVDPIARMRGVMVNRAFSDCTPAVVCKAILAQAGLAAFMPVDGPEKHHFLLQQRSALECAGLIREAWSLDWDIYYSDGLVYWGPLDQSVRHRNTNVQVIERGKQLLSLTPAGDLWDATVVFNPWLQHSHRVIIADAEIFGQAAVLCIERVVHRYSTLVTEMQCRVIA